MVLITSAKYINSELQSEFGKIPPSFLPLGGKRLYEYQARLFPNEKVVLSLPEDFEISYFDRKKLNNLNVRIVQVPNGISLGESIIYALNMNLPIENNIEILHGDTYFSRLDRYKENVLSISKAEKNYDWTYLFQDNMSILNYSNLVLDQVEKKEDFIVSGYFNIEKPYQFIQEIIRNNYSFIEALKDYSRRSPFFILQNKTWLDFGLVSNYFHSKKFITTERAFNTLEIKNGYVYKQSSFIGKLDGEISWFQNIPEELSLNIPRFYSNSHEIYKTEYLYLNTLSELFVFGKLPLDLWEKIFYSIKYFTSRLHNYKYNDSKKINFDFKFKTLERISLFSTERDISLTKKWVFNQIQMPSLVDIIEDISNVIDPVKEFSFIHGDLCFSNIMYDFRSNNIKVFDPRGIDFNGNVTVYGDSRYDFAKLTHSVIGLYDLILADFFECSIENDQIYFNIEISKDMQTIQNTFLEIFDIETKGVIMAITIHLFISMLPLHNDNLKKQDALFANIFRLYEIFKKVN
jgi:hypothetical protein